MPGPFETRLFINGEYVDAKTSSRLSCYNPADGSLITDDVHVADEEDVNTAVAAARAAFPGWAAKPPAERASILLRFADLLEANGQEIVQLDTLVSGKPKLLGNMSEVDLPVKAIRYFAGWGDKIQGDVAPATEGFLRIVTHEPLGVCAGICPFNAPILMAVAKSIPALITGNTVVIKSSEKTPLNTLALGRLANEAGLPPGTINLLSGAGPTGALLASHPDVNKISFTGSTATGRKIAQMAASSNLKRVALELGGKSPAIIFPDANLQTAVEWTIRGFTSLSGQVCVATSRVYVHKDIKDQFLAALQAGLQAAEAVIGDPNLETTMIGPIVDKIQFDRVTGYIQSGKEEANLIHGGSQVGEKGFFVKPTVFVDPTPNAKIYKEEIFGPVAVVSEFEDEADVLARANDTQYGLNAAVFSQDINRALRVASKLQSGTVCVNCSTQSSFDVPFGGTKQSGWGREGGKYGILAYTEPKSTFINLTY